MSEIIDSNLPALKEQLESLLLSVANTLVILASRPELEIDLQNLTKSGPIRSAIVDLITENILEYAVDKKVISMKGVSAFRSPDWERLVSLLKKPEVMEELLADVQLLVNGLK